MVWQREVTVIWPVNSCPKALTLGDQSEGRFLISEKSIVDRNLLAEHWPNSTSSK
jgi:hypothetical protein